MSIDVDPSKFFVAGGTLSPTVTSYVTRPADNQLFQATLQSEFCYVLTPRQMGKSSLMVRTAVRLQKRGIRAVIADLTQIGTTEIDADQWYLGFLAQIAKGLNLSLDLSITHKFVL